MIRRNTQEPGARHPLPDGPARERELDRRSFIIPLAVVAYVAQTYVHSIPSAGNDLVLIDALRTVGLTLAQETRDLLDGWASQGWRPAAAAVSISLVMSSSTPSRASDPTCLADVPRRQPVQSW